MGPSGGKALHDVLAYPSSVLERREGVVRVSVTYYREWSDGFGARGWKLDAAIGDEEIIASTRETGERIPTSVFVHDLLDHLLSGFALSGHRAEAMALIQLQRRTGTDIRPDYAQMVREDLMVGRVLGEDECLRDFIGDDLAGLVDDPGLEGRELVGALRRRLGDAMLEAALVERFFVLGKRGIAYSVESLRALGLDERLPAPMGLALQAALREIDERLQRLGVECAHGFAWVSNSECGIEVDCDAGRFISAQPLKKKDGGVAE